MFGELGQVWQDSSVYNKLSNVLWVPILALRSIPPKDRLIGTPFLVSSESEESALRQDWEEIMEHIALGRVESITAKLGEALQLRPKAANSRALTRALVPTVRQLKPYLVGLPQEKLYHSHFSPAVLYLNT